MSSLTPNPTPENPRDPITAPGSFYTPEDTVRLRKPRNTTTKRIFIAATRQNDGKTTTSLGLFSALQKRSEHIGFIKPIGQRFIEQEGYKVDEDTVLLDSVYKVEIPIDAMSPVAIEPSFTRRYLENPDDSLEVIIDKMCRAFDRAAYQREYIIIEGSGHAGVGSVFDMSNAQGHHRGPGRHRSPR